MKNNAFLITFTETGRAALKGRTVDTGSSYRTVPDSIASSMESAAAKTYPKSVTLELPEGTLEAAGEALKLKNPAKHIASIQQA